MKHHGSIVSSLQIQRTDLESLLGKQSVGWRFAQQELTEGCSQDPYLWGGSGGERASLGGGRSWAGAHPQQRPQPSPPEALLLECPSEMSSPEARSRLCTPTLASQYMGCPRKGHGLGQGSSLWLRTISREGLTGELSDARCSSPLGPCVLGFGFVSQEGGASGHPPPGV